MQIGLDTDLASTVKNIYKLRGMRGFYAGYFSLICREIPFSAIQLPVYETMKIIQKNYNKKVGWTGGLTWYQDA
jgi:solute carrier family 25 S-adenosylmethionine transporter 26